MRAESHSLRAPLGGFLALCALCTALLLALVSPTARAATCTNEAIRVEQGQAVLALPDCRAYELVSPGSIVGLTSESRVEIGGKTSPEGSAIAYTSVYPASDSPASTETWLSKRTASGWSIESLEPQMTPTSTTYAKCLPAVALSEGLDAQLLSAGGDIYSSEALNPTGECGKPAEELVAGEPRGYSNLYLRREGNPYELANPVPFGETPGNATYQDGSDDLSRVVFTEAAKLTPEAPAGINLFIWANGAVRLIGVLPNGEPVLAKLPAATGNWDNTGGKYGLAPVSHAVSADGERVFFEANGNLYLRENAGQPPAAVADCRKTSEPDLACTLQLDLNKGGVDLSGGGGVFQYASRDGASVFFTSDLRLKPKSKAQAGKPALYEYRVATRELFDVTLNPGETVPDVRGFSGGSDDGSYLYFVARGVLTGSEQNSQGERAAPEQPNLYLTHEGSLTYIATLSPWEVGLNLGGKDRANWFQTNGPTLKTAWSPSGRYLLFSSRKSLTGFDNTPASPGLCAGEARCQELYLYDAKAEGLSCVSCDPGGANPAADTKLVAKMEFSRFVEGPRYLPRIVLDSGQVFFETTNALLPQDVNGVQDVYEFNSGNLNLISTGTAVGGSAFVDASADGSNIFLATPESLVRRDDDGGLPSLYDARVDGGFAEPPPPEPPCTDENTCRPPGSPPPPAGSPSTAGFAGSGNVKPKPCKHGKVRRGGKCVKRKKHRHHKRNRDSNNRGAK